MSTKEYPLSPTGIVRNNTDVSQSYGRYTIAPRGFGELPIEVIDSLLRHPIKELTVLQTEVWRRTEHWPDGVRYRERACAAHQR